MTVEIQNGRRGTAVFDGTDCRYRYHLTRTLDKGKKDSVGFVMLNPSKADQNRDDDTVNKCIGFSRRWNKYRTLEVGNLYAWYATHPTELLDAPAQTGPIGPHNDGYLYCLATRCSIVVAAWGDGASKKRANHVLRLLWEAMESAGRTPMIHRLGELTQEGHPRHPVRLKKKTKLQEWNESGSPPQVR